MEISVKKSKFSQKAKILARNRNFGQKLKFCPEIDILVKNLKINQSKSSIFNFSVSIKIDQSKSRDFDFSGKFLANLKHFCFKKWQKNGNCYFDDQSSSVEPENFWNFRKISFKNSN